MASIGWEGKRAKITYRDSKNKQQSLRLGECLRADARTACVAVGHLVIAKRHNSVPHPDATRWLGGLDDVLYARVAALGLCQPRESAAVVTLGELLKRIDAAASVRDGTRTTYRQAFKMMRDHFGESMPIDSITPAHADQWRKAIAEPKQVGKGKPAKALAPATIAKRVKVAKAVFAKGMKWGLLASNPFADLRVGSQSNPDRNYYVSLEVFRTILDSCADLEWRAIIGLSRLAGLRCPSEVAALRWGDVNWERGRLMVRSAKTAGHEGHAVRVVPLDPKLAKILQDLFDRAEPGTEAVVPRLRGPKVNLRTGFERIIEKAGLQSWPRLFHNMRSSRATDWIANYPVADVSNWLGHSATIGAAHYWQPRDANMDLAAGLGADCAATNPATHTRQSAPKRDQRDDAADRGETQNRQIAADLVGVGAVCDSVEKEKTPAEAREVTPMGFEPMSLP